MQNSCFFSFIFLATVSFKKSIVRVELEAMTREDKVDMEGKHHFDPNFKPDFNLDLLHTQNYICHFFVAKKSVVDQTDGFRPMYDGAQDFDFIFGGVSCVHT